MIKILHTGDIHLDAPFTKLSANDSMIRRNELRLAFNSLMDFVEENKINIVLFAGDIFDDEYITRDTVHLMVKKFKESNAKIVIAPGNHDPASENSVWNKKNIFPSNVYIFKRPNSAKISFDDLNCDVYGYAFNSQSLYNWPLDGKHPESNDRINLVCAHADLEVPNSPYCKVSKEQIEDFGADYYAFGHVHNPQEHISKIGNSYYGYCGCLLSRSFNDTGVKGANYIEIEKNNGIITRFESKFITFSKTHYEVSKINLTGTESAYDIPSKIKENISNFKDTANLILQLILEGSVHPDLLINKAQLKNSFQEIKYLDIIDHTIPTYNVSELANDPTLKGEFYRMLYPKLCSNNDEEREIAIKAFRLGLAALNGEKKPIL